MHLRNNSILNSNQFTKTEIEELFQKAQFMSDIYHKKTVSSVLKGKILASIFFEPSTRTRFSFESAMLRLGGNIISNADMMGTSSIKKQETLYDTGKMISQFADVIIMRHPTPHAVHELKMGSDVPVINAGDGAHEHPTQGLLDLYTIHKHFKKFDNLTIGMVGDLKHSRVIHSQCTLLKHFPVKFILVSPTALALPAKIIKTLKENNHKIEITDNLNKVIHKMDVLSHTRIQEERFATPSEYQKFKGVYIVNKQLLTQAKKNMIIISPFPRVDELPREVDLDSRAKYFEQVQNGVIMRMTLLNEILS